MVGRIRTQDGKRVTVSVKISEADAAAIDALTSESGSSRSEWLQQLIGVAIASWQDSRASRRRPRRDECPHPKARVHKGLCGACGTGVGTAKETRRA